jgi:hypothetical protein
MKQIALTFLVCLLFCSPASALIYNYEITGAITYSDFDNAYGYDPFIDIGNTTFRLFGMWGDLGTKAYTTINGVTFVNENSTDLFKPHNSNGGGDFDALEYHEIIPNPLRIWFISGFEYSQEFVSDEGSVNWGMFSKLDWKILWIGVTPDDPNLPEYWEDGGTITSASLTVTPVPEPATIFLWGIGMAVFVGSRLRRKRPSHELLRKKVF